MIKAGIIGATGYGGVEIARILLGHPEAEIEAISSVSYEGQNIADIYPAFRKILEKTLVNEAEVIEKCDVIFAAVPHGLSQEIAGKCDKAGKILIDLGADFRLKKESDYKKWYDGDFLDKNLHEKAVYGLPELYREEIKGAKLVANPGCYPTGAALGLAPILKALGFKEDSIIIDAKSGVTGAGRSPSETTHYANLNENFYPYKIASHRHKPEIAQTVAQLSGKSCNVIFTPHLLPINRGILSTIYIKATEQIALEELYKLYKDFYEAEYFVRVLPLGSVAQVAAVRYSNYCDISVHMDEAANQIIIVSAIDNMFKGAAGQAVQNMNIVFGIDETTGLEFLPPAF